MRETSRLPCSRIRSAVQSIGDGTQLHAPEETKKREELRIDADTVATPPANLGVSANNDMAHAV